MKDLGGFPPGIRDETRATRRDDRRVVLLEWARPEVLQGVLVRLEPLEPRHGSDLWEVGQDEAIWRWLPAFAPRNLDEMTRLIERALTEKEQGWRLPFAVIDLESSRAIGTTSYLDIEPSHRRIEIGWTWFGRAWWGTGRNEESKLLLLRHAFESLHAQRVSLKTDAQNRRSQAAIERVGGVHEGVLRKHYLRPDGSSRDTVYFSVIDSEWPSVQLRLVALVSQRSER